MKSKSIDKVRCEVFRTPRLNDFCTLKGLTAEIGYGVADWPVVVPKELLDNAIDICDEIAVAPIVKIDVDAGSIQVTDNGPGIDAETVAGVVDFNVRVSAREARICPTRGSQGNFLKCLVAMPFVLSSQEGRVDISAQGIRHEITVRVDQIRGRPIIDHRQVTDRFVKTGNP
jgi:DNA topoisomerase VI subunit B